MQSIVSSEPIMSLYASLLASFAQPREPAAPTRLRDRPLVALGPQSTLGILHLRNLLNAGAQFVLAVDDYCHDAQIEGIPVITSAQLIERAASLAPGAVAIDFSQRHYSTGFYRELGRRVGLELHDLLQAQACFDTAGVYETVRTYRARTLERADDWLKLAQRLGDEHSRETLYGVLLQRLEYDRRWTAAVRISGIDEYFGYATESATFVLGHKEHFVDCGAYRGTVIQKLLDVTNWRYASIHAFEPDADNFAALKQWMPWSLDRFQAHPYAVAEKAQTLRFWQTGTMGSFISEQGNVSMECVAIDERVEQASFIKFDVEGFEPRALRGARQLLARCRPRLAVAGYHYANDLLDIAQTIDELAPDYTLYLRHHFGYFYDSILYATPRTDWLPLEHAA